MSYLTTDESVAQLNALDNRPKLIAQYNALKSQIKGLREHHKREFEMLLLDPVLGDYQVTEKTLQALEEESNGLFLYATDSFAGGPLLWQVFMQAYGIIEKEVWTADHDLVPLHRWRAEAIDERFGIFVVELSFVDVGGLSIKEVKRLPAYEKALGEEMVLVAALQAGNGFMRALLRDHQASIVVANVEMSRPSLRFPRVPRIYWDTSSPSLHKPGIDPHLASRPLPGGTLLPVAKTGRRRLVRWP